MQAPDPVAKGTLMRPPRSPQRADDLAVVRPAQTIDDSGQPHCADHATFHPGCAVCKRACANFQPYPLRPGKPVTRSFGFTDDLTESKLRELNPKPSNLYQDDPDFSLSLSILRLLRRLIWPF